MSNIDLNAKLEAAAEAKAGAGLCFSISASIKRAVPPPELQGKVVPQTFHEVLVRRLSK